MSETRLGLMRLGRDRLDRYAPTLMITVNGVDRSTGDVLIEGLSIREVLDGTPNTATFRFYGFTPVKGQIVKIGLGSLDPEHSLFQGHILTTQQIYLGDKSTNIAWDVSCIGYEWLLNRRKVTARYTNASASAIALDLVTTWTDGFTGWHIDPSLPTIDEITFTNEDVIDCFDRLCKRIGGYWFTDYGKDVHLFITSAEFAHTIEDGAVYGARDLVAETDLSQVRTRVFVEGDGSLTTVGVAVGATTIPLASSTFANASGGTVVSGPQRLAYTSKSLLDGTGSKIGGKTGLAPGVPTATIVSETSGNLSVGQYRYAVSFVINGGETEAGNNSSQVTITHITILPSFTLGQSAGGSLTALGFYVYAATYLTAAGETTANVGQIQLTGGNQTVNITSLSTSSDDRVTGRRLYRAYVGGGDGQWRFVATINDNTTTTYTDSVADASLTVTPLPVTNTSGSGRIDLSNIPVGPTGTTSRRLYRSPVNVVSNSGYKFLDTLTGNVTTTYADNVADTQLGDELPLTSEVGPTAGDASLPVQDLAMFAGTGGWVESGNQLIRYTGRSASSGTGTLTGVPTSGAGAITSTIPYDTVVVNAPHLTGVTGVLYTIHSGDPVNLLVTVDDAAAQTVMAGLVGGDGIHEDYLQDRRLSETEATARGTAHLNVVKDPLVTMTYETRDQTTRAGRTVTFDLDPPTSLTGTFKIQSVTITDIHPLGLIFPKRTVTASSRRFAFEDLLRQQIRTG